ncbi:MAG: hypothetical protein ACXW32_00600 [Limisphaerales bacterium]
MSGRPSFGPEDSGPKQRVDIIPVPIMVQITGDNTSVSNEINGLSAY